MCGFRRFAVLLAIALVLPLTPATPAAAVIHNRNCSTASDGYDDYTYVVRFCVKIEYLPGGVRALVAFDCFQPYDDPYREVDVACNYEVYNLFLGKGQGTQRTLPYGHVTGTGYHQFATPWVACDENKTASYSAGFVDANVRFPNGRLVKVGGLNTTRPPVLISCA